MICKVIVEATIDAENFEDALMKMSTYIAERCATQELPVMEGVHRVKVDVHKSIYEDEINETPVQTKDFSSDASPEDG